MKDNPIDQSPALCQPSLDKQDISQLKTDLPKWKPWLTQHSWDEWTNFIENEVQKVEEAPSDSPIWPLQEMSNNPHDELETEDAGEGCDPQSTILLEKERQECTVSAGDKYVRPGTIILTIN